MDIANANSPIPGFSTKIVPNLHSFTYQSIYDSLNLCTYWVFQKKMFCFFPNEKQLGFHFRYHFFLRYGWFLQNFEKDVIRTNMQSAHDCSRCVLGDHYIAILVLCYVEDWGKRVCYLPCQPYAIEGAR